MNERGKPWPVNLQPFHLTNSRYTLWVTLISIRFEDHLVHHVHLKLAGRGNDSETDSPGFSPSHKGIRRTQTDGQEDPKPLGPTPTTDCLGLGQATRAGHISCPSRSKQD